MEVCRDSPDSPVSVTRRDLHTENLLMSRPLKKVVAANKLPFSVFLVAVLLPVYGFLPVCAGFLSIGDRRGPIIYPKSFHEALFVIGWESSSSNVGKPRVPFGGWSSSRPLFYGLGWSEADVEKGSKQGQHQKSNEGWE